MKQIEKLVIFSVATMALSVCQSNASFTAYNGNLFEVVDNVSVITWEDAQADAVLLGGHLAVITDAAENTFVYNLIGSSATVWFGGRNPTGPDVSSANWSWVNGETWSYAPWATAQGQPDGAEGYPDYTLFWSAGGSNWGDAGDPWATTSGNAHEYVVEVPVPEASTIVAGALMLLPFGVSTLRIMRKKAIA
jgi:hypothetical protein